MPKSLARPRALRLLPVALMACASPALAADPPVVPAAVEAPYSLEIEGFWERTRFAPDRTFGLVLGTNAMTGARQPVRPFARFDTRGERYGAEATLRTAPVLELFGGPARLFGSLLFAQEDSSFASSPDARGGFPILTNRCFPSFGPPTAAPFMTHCTALGATPNRRSSFDFDHDGRIVGGAIGIERPMQLEGLRITPALGIVIDRTRRNEAILVLDNPGAPATTPDDRIDATVNLRSTFVGARLGLSTALPIAPTFEWINRFHADLGVTHASLDGTSRHTRPSFAGAGFIFPAVDLAGRQSASDDAFSVRLSLASGFSWRPAETISVNLLGTVGWRSREPYAAYPDIVWPAGGFAQEVTSLRVGWDSQWSYGLRGGVTVRF